MHGPRKGILGTAEPLVNGWPLGLDITRIATGRLPGWTSRQGALKVWRGPLSV